MEDLEGLDEIIAEFLVESHENLDQLDRDLVELERAPGSRDLLASIFRTIHTIKGTSGFLAFSQLESLTHVGENLLAKLRDGRLTMTPGTTDVLLGMVDRVRELLASIEADGTEGSVEVRDVVQRISDVLEGREVAVEDHAEAAVVDGVSDEAAGAPRRSVADSSIRVDVELLDSLMRQVGELVLTRNQIVRQAGHGDDLELTRSTQRLNQIATELQQGVMKTRMQPIDHLWAKLPRVVRDLGAACGKQVELVMVGRETELDRSLLESVKDPLTHLVRNAVDHGLESPERRAAAGKQAEGRVTLRAHHQGGQVVVEVCDDGGGIDPAAIAAKAVERGLRTAAQVERMTQTELLQLIFAPGFSTAAAVTNVSGRGVGMDVVKTNIEAMGGTIEIESVLGRGTTCRLRIPLTLAIVPSLVVECAGDTYAIGQVSLLELVALDAERASRALEDVNGAPVHRLRGVLLPLVRLADVLGVESVRDDGHVLIAVLQSEGRRFGLVIDRVLSTEDVVVKPLTARIKQLGTYSGATILGDGRVALILDVEGIARRALSSEGLDVDADLAESERTATEPDRWLVARIGGGRRVALPLEVVTRLETFSRDAVEQVGIREVVQYRGDVLPLLRLDRHLGAGSGGQQARDRDDLVVVIHQAGDRGVAIVVEEIVDIVDEQTGVQSTIVDRGLTGSVRIRDRVVEVLDVRDAVLAADPGFYDLDPGTAQAWESVPALEAM